MSTPSLTAHPLLSSNPDLAALVSETTRQGNTVIIAQSKKHLRRLSMGVKPGTERLRKQNKILCHPDGMSPVNEGSLVRVRNPGIAVNFSDPGLRRRAADCMYIDEGDGTPTDKPLFADHWGRPFAEVREETFKALATGDLVLAVVTFPIAGLNKHVVVVAPARFAVFCAMASALQKLVPLKEIPDDIKPDGIVYLMPEFRHTHFEGRQVVVHSRTPDCYSMFAYNLYPGPSLKKGMYGMLLHWGQYASQPFTILHCAAIVARTPFGNTTASGHAGPSGGGKTETGQYPPREHDGRMLIGTHIDTGATLHLTLNRGVEKQIVCDDMGFTRSGKNGGHIRCRDAEQGWFVRCDELKHPTDDPELIARTLDSKHELMFLNINAVPGSRACLSDHVWDDRKANRRCTNPRLIAPRESFPNAYDGEVELDYLSWGLRQPPLTSTIDSYGIVGFIQRLNWPLYWLWNLASPRGHANPSITGDSDGLASEGVGSFWPFATGQQASLANVLLTLFRDNPKTEYLLYPNQFVGAYRVGFAPQWVGVEYYSRCGQQKPDLTKYTPARCSLLGWTPKKIELDSEIPEGLLRPEKQPDVGTEAYDRGAKRLADFFRKTVGPLHSTALDPAGRRIISCMMDGGTAQDFEALARSLI